MSNSAASKMKMLCSKIESESWRPFLMGFLNKLRLLYQRNQRPLQEFKAEQLLLLVRASQRVSKLHLIRDQLPRTKTLLKLTSTQVWPVPISMLVQYPTPNNSNFSRRCAFNSKRMKERFWSLELKKSAFKVCHLGISLPMNFLERLERGSLRSETLQRSTKTLNQAF